MKFAAKFFELMNDMLPHTPRKQRSKSTKSESAPGQSEQFYSRFHIGRPPCVRLCGKLSERGTMITSYLKFDRKRIRLIFFVSFLILSFYFFFFILFRKKNTVSLWVSLVRISRWEFPKLSLPHNLTRGGLPI